MSHSGTTLDDNCSTVDNFYADDINVLNATETDVINDGVDSTDVINTYTNNNNDNTIGLQDEPIASNVEVSHYIIDANGAHSATCRNETEIMSTSLQHLPATGDSISGYAIDSTKDDIVTSVMEIEPENSIGLNQINNNDNIGNIHKSNNSFETSNCNVIESSSIMTEGCSMDECVNEEITQNIDEQTRDGVSMASLTTYETTAGNEITVSNDDEMATRNEPASEGSSMPAINADGMNRTNFESGSADLSLEQESASTDTNDPSSLHGVTVADGVGSSSVPSTSSINAETIYSNDSDLLYGTVLSAESIKVIAESIGISALPDDAAKELAEDITIKIKRIVQDGLKFMYHSKREKLRLTDLDHALRMRNLEPQYGFVANEHIPFRFASGGGRELHFVEEKEIDLTEVTQINALKIPMETTVRAHWLAVDGIQPTIPENPPPLSKEVQLTEAVNPIMKLDHSIGKDIAGKPAIGKLHKLRNVETVHVKQLATHELSVEQQLYYKEITEACVGADESRRGEALQSLACDPGLYEMLPRMCTFIAEGVKVNVVQTNLAILIYLMRMVKALLDNPTLYLEKYLHELIPSVVTCIVTKQLCARPELDNHWALRDFASRLMSQICKTFNTSTNDLQTRVTRVFSKAFANDKVHLPSLYGALTGLSELGPEVIKVFIIPQLKFISDRLEIHFQSSAQSNTDKTAAGHIRAMLQKVCAPILKQMRSPPDIPDEYKMDFGILGPPLCQSVMKARNSSGSSTSLVQSAPTSSSPYYPSMAARQTGGQFMANRQMSSPGIGVNRTTLNLQSQMQMASPQIIAGNTEDVADSCSTSTSNNFSTNNANTSISYRKGSMEILPNIGISNNSNKTINISNLRTANNSNNKNNNNNKSNFYNARNYGGSISHNNNNYNSTINSSSSNVHFSSAGASNNNGNNVKINKNNITKNFSNMNPNGNSDFNTSTNNNYVISGKSVTIIGNKNNTITGVINNPTNNPSLKKYISNPMKNPMNSPAMNNPNESPISNTIINTNNNSNVTINNNPNNNSNSNINSIAGSARDNGGHNRDNGGMDIIVSNRNIVNPNMNNTFVRNNSNNSNTLLGVTLHTIVNVPITKRHPDSNNDPPMDVDN